MSGLNWVQENMVALLVSTLLYGAYTMIFGACMYALIFRQDSSPLRHRLLLVTIALFLLSTAQTVLTFLGAFMTTHVTSDDPDSAVVSEIVLANTLDTIADGLQVCAMCIADGLLIWRCYILYRKQIMIVAAPIMFLVGSSVCGLLNVAFQAKYILCQLHAPSTVFNLTPEELQLDKKQDSTIRAQFIFSCITNMLMSSLIAFQIWKATKDIGKAKRKYLRVAWLMLETGVLYSICLVLLAIINGLYIGTTTGAILLMDVILSNIMQQLTGIFPTVIILLVALGWSSDQSVQYSERANPNARQQSKVSTIQFASPPAPAQTSDAMGGTATIEIQTRHISFGSSEPADRIPREEP
ncbi:hypothetical protein NEOLEDRAFT_122779 [Neolentinus lepideus HHB14362 ss-1]|uniref:Uncharacterized protein n=1 Tax=Neolentinus lepideus HHB14362 ss-1 TaxID=1314782 RepID=A0A165MSM9_9AGAM|nr:hypothetical protein NEOLEDRAFT_122779 [Neolentinus lepideus HHB14362 ss-1]